MYQKSFWKRIFAVMISAAITVPVATSSFIPVSATINLYDVWVSSEVIEEESVLPDYVQRAFDEAMEGYNGLPLTPIAYYGTQVVAGYNYALICQERLNNGNISLKEVTIYDPLSGNGEEKAKIYVSDFNLKDYETSYSYPLPQQPPCGSMEIADDMSGASITALAIDSVLFIVILPFSRPFMTGFNTIYVHIPRKVPCLHILLSERAGNKLTVDFPAYIIIRTDE